MAPDDHGCRRGRRSGTVERDARRRRDPREGARGPDRHAAPAHHVRGESYEGVVRGQLHDLAFIDEREEELATVLEQKAETVAKSLATREVRHAMGEKAKSHPVPGPAKPVLHWPSVHPEPASRRVSSGRADRGATPARQRPARGRAGPPGRKRLATPRGCRPPSHRRRGWAARARRGRSRTSPAPCS